MPYIRSELNKKIRELTLDTFNKRKRQLGANEAARIQAILRSGDHVVPFTVPTSLGDVLGPEELNRFFDQVYTDHSIMMRDIDILYGAFREIIGKIKRKFIKPRLDIKKSVSTIQNFLKSKGYSSKYNFVDSYHFALETNLSPNRDKLVVDKGAGVLHLPTSDVKTYTSEEDLNITTGVVSKGVYSIRTTPTEALFDPDLTWYKILVASKVRNPDPYNTYNGVIVYLDIQLPSPVPVNELRVRLISDLAEEILDVLYTDRNDTVSLEHLGNYDVVNNSYVTSISFEPVVAKTIRLVVGSKMHETVTEETIIKGGVDPEYIGKVVEEIRDIQAENRLTGATLPEDEVVKRLTNVIYERDRKIPETYRIYAVALRSIEVRLSEYEAFGEFLGSQRRLEGNVAYVKVQTDGIEKRGINSVVKVILAGKEYSLGIVDDEGYVNDTVVVKLGNELDPTRRYYFETNFIPQRDTMQVYLGSKELSLADIVDTSLTESLPNGDRFFLREESNIVDKTILAVRYKPSKYDRAGILYDPEALDIIYSVGKPNTKNNRVANRVSNWVYFYDKSVNIVRYRIEDVKIVNERLRLPLGTNYATTYGEDLDINYGSSSMGEVVYSSETSSGFIDLDIPYFGPFIGVYSMITEEKSIDQNGKLYSGSGASITYGTSVPYVANTIVVTQDGVPVDITEYSVNFGAPHVFTDVTVDTNTVDTSKPVEVTYMPIPDTQGAIDPLATSNIERHNAIVTLSVEKETKEVELESYPFIDPDITSSSSFTKSRGGWIYKHRSSIIYEPFVVYHNQRKLEYLKDYESNGRKLLFNTPISGNLSIKYYSLADRITPKVEMYSQDPSRTRVTNRLGSLLILAKVVK